MIANFKAVLRDILGGLRIGFYAATNLEKSGRDIVGF